MAYRFNILFLFGIAIQCSNALVLEDKGIVQFATGGQDADPNGIARSVVQIIRNGLFTCTGSIIDSFTVVTAKHCFKKFGTFLDSNTTKFEVVYGSVQRLNPDNEGNFRRAFIRDDGFHLHDWLDVTVLSLDSEMIGAVPMQLDEQSSTYCDMPVQLYGFGVVDDEGNKPNVVQVVDTVVKTGCGEKWYDPYRRIITQVDGRAGCKGDSGGPLVNAQTGQMVGIHVAGDANCLPGDRNYSVKLSTVIQFIRTFTTQC